MSCHSPRGGPRTGHKLPLPARRNPQPSLSGSGTFFFSPTPHVGYGCCESHFRNVEGCESGFRNGGRRRTVLCRVGRE
ncbi:hypothetical protein B0293_36085 [Amycolatopsis azurea DSM 43854]|uniref:Uncharacterized protein n=1 Tax=Amycolatopsis azurea DSM 43854 TaxID=1238180 RepID=A0ABX3J284_9PSEU|nr:hypothetical protein B0293_36085 [Amycolatopsis azurea DSM 43854]